MVENLLDYTCMCHSPVENGVVKWEELSQMDVDMSVLHSGGGWREVGEPVVSCSGVLFRGVVVRVLLSAPSHSPAKMLVGAAGTRKLSGPFGNTGGER